MAADSTMLPRWRIPARALHVTVLSLFAVFLVVVIGSYSPLDPAWSQASNDEIIRNLLGTVGATTADVLIFVFGQITFAIPVFLVLKISSLLFVDKSSNWHRNLVDLGGMLLALCSLCCLASLWVGGADEILHRAGGYIGMHFAKLGSHYITGIGLAFLCTAGVLVGAQLVVRSPWLAMIEALGHAIYTFGSFLWIGRSEQYLG